MTQQEDDSSTMMPSQLLMNYITKSRSHRASRSRCRMRRRKEPYEDTQTKSYKNSKSNRHTNKSMSLFIPISCSLVATLLLINLIIYTPSHAVAVSLNARLDRQNEDETTTAPSNEMPLVESTTTSSFDRLVGDELLQASNNQISPAPASDNDEYFSAGQAPTRAPDEANNSVTTTTPSADLIVTTLSAHDQLSDHSSVSPIEATAGNDEETTTMSPSTESPEPSSTEPSSSRRSSEDNQEQQSLQEAETLVRNRKSSDTSQNLRLEPTSSPSRNQSEATASPVAINRSNLANETRQQVDQGDSSSAQFDYDDFDLDYQLKFNASNDLAPSNTSHNSKRDQEAMNTKPPSWSTLIKQPHLFTPTTNQTQVHQVAQGPVLPSLLTVKSTQLTNQEMEKVRPQFLLYQDDAGGPMANANDQSQAFANGDLLATASQTGGAGSMSVRLSNNNNTEDLHLQPGGDIGYSRGGRQQHPSTGASDLDRGSGEMISTIRPATNLLKSRSDTNQQPQQAVTTSPADNSATTTTEAPNSKGQSQANQWFNYPHPNLHHNPLLLHHILNKPSLYAQHVGAIQQQSQQPAGSAVASTSLLTKEHHQPTLQPTPVAVTSTSSAPASASAASNVLSIIERPTHADHPQNQLIGSTFNKTQLEMQLNEMRAIAAAAAQQKSQTNQAQVRPLLNVQSMQIKPVVAAQAIGKPITVDAKAPIQVFSQVDPHRPATKVYQAHWLPSKQAAAEKLAAPLSFQLVKPPLASQIVAAPSFLQEVYAKPATGFAVKPSTAETQDILRNSKTNQTSKAQSAISDEDMSTYVAQLASQQNNNNQWTPSNVNYGEQHLANNTSNNDLDALIQKLLTEASSQQQQLLSQNTSAHQVQWTDPPPAVAKQTQDEQAALMQHLMRQQFGSMASPSQQSLVSGGSRLFPPRYPFFQPNPASSDINQNYHNIEGHQRQQKKEREHLEALIQIKNQRQLAFMEAIRASLAKNGGEPSKQYANGSSLIDDIASLATVDSNTTSPAGAALHLGEEFDEQVSNKPIPDWLERQIIQDSFIHESSRINPLAQTSARNVIIGRNPFAAWPPAAAGIPRPMMGAASSISETQLAMPHPPLNAAQLASLAAFASRLHPINQQQLAAAASQLSIRPLRGPTFGPELPMANSAGQVPIRLFPLMAPQAGAPQPLAGSLMAESSASPTQQTSAGSSGTTTPTQTQLPSPLNPNVYSPATRLLAERFPLASAPAYMVKLPTLTGGTITAAGSFLPPGSTATTAIRFHRPRPVPLRLLSAAASMAPARLRLMTHNMLQQSSSSARPFHQAPPQMHPLHSLATYHQQALMSHAGHYPYLQATATSPYQMLPGGLSGQAAPILTLNHHHHIRPVSDPMSSSPQSHHMTLFAQQQLKNVQEAQSTGASQQQPTPAPVPAQTVDSSNSTTAKQSPANEATKTTSQQLTVADLTNLLNGNQPLQQSQSTQDNSLYTSSSSQQEQSNPGLASSGTTNSPQNPALTLNRLQQATNSLVELTSIASLIEELAGGSGIDPSPALALANAITALSTAHNSQQHQTLSTQASSQSTASTGNQDQPLVMNTPFSLKSLLAWRDRQSGRARELGALERLLVNTARRPPVARLRVKYIRVPVAVYENSLTGDTGALIVPPRHRLVSKAQLAELVANAAAHASSSSGFGSASSTGSGSASSLNTAASVEGESSATPKGINNAGSAPDVASSPGIAATTSTNNDAGSTNPPQTNGAPNTASSSNDYLFDELSTDPSVPKLALALRELANHRQQQLEESSSDLVPRIELLPVALASNSAYSNRNLKSVSNSMKSLVPVPVTGEQLSPLESAMYMSMVAAPSGQSPALLDPSAVRATSGKTYKSLRSNKKKTRKGGKKHKDADMDNETEGESENEETEEDPDDDKLSSKDLPIIESLLSTIIHGPRPHPSGSPSSLSPYSAAASQQSPITLLPFGPVVASGSGHQPAIIGAATWRPRVAHSLGNLRAEASTMTESYAPAGYSPVPRPQSNHIIRAHPFTKQMHKFSLGEVVGALGARKLITSLLSKRKRSRTSKRATMQQPANKHKYSHRPSHKLLFRLIGKVPASSSLVGKRRPHTAGEYGSRRPGNKDSQKAPRLQQESQSGSKGSAENEATSSNNLDERYKTTPASVTIWYPTSADHELTTAASVAKPSRSHDRAAAPTTRLPLPKPTTSPNLAEVIKSLTTEDERHHQPAAYGLTAALERQQQRRKLASASSTTTSSPSSEESVMRPVAVLTQANRLPQPQQSGAGGAPPYNLEQSLPHNIHNRHTKFQSAKSAADDKNQETDEPTEFYLKTNQRKRPITESEVTNNHKQAKKEDGAPRAKRKEDVMAMPLYHVVADHYSKLHIGPSATPKSSGAIDQYRQ